MLRFGLRVVALIAVGALAMGCGDPDLAVTSGGFGGSGGSVSAAGVVTGVVGVGVTSGSGLPSISFQSGSRLRAHVLDAGGAARSFEGWYDAELEMDCTSTAVAGQPNRCFPPRVEEVVFVDDACTSAAVPASALPADVPPYVVEPHSGSQTCDAYRAWLVGPETQAPTIYALGPAGCAEVGVDTTVRTLTPVPLETFAELDVVDQSITAFDWRRVENGPDGSFRAVTALESPSGGPCEVFARFTDSSRPCLPSQRVRRRPEFADGACGAPAIALGKCEIAGNQRIVDLNPDPCAAEAASLFAAGDIVSDVSEHVGADCVATGEKGRRLGAPALPPFGTGVYQDFRQGTPLLMLLDVASAVPVRADGKFVFSYDNFNPCTVARTGVGLRCVPPFSAHTRTFADAACTEPVVSVLGQACGLAPALAGQIGDDGGLEALRNLDATHTGDVYSNASGTCVVISPGGSPWRRVQQGDLPLDTYAELTEYIE